MKGYSIQRFILEEEETKLWLLGKRRVFFQFDTDNELNSILHGRIINVFINVYIVHATKCFSELVNAETLKPKSTQQYKVYSKEITYKLKFPNT